jgi:hypothetical protein
MFGFGWLSVLGPWFRSFSRRSKFGSCEGGADFSAPGVGAVGVDVFVLG